MLGVGLLGVAAWHSSFGVGGAARKVSDVRPTPHYQLLTTHCSRLLLATLGHGALLYLEDEAAEGVTVHGPQHAVGGGDDGGGAGRVVHESELAEGAALRVGEDEPAPGVLQAVVKLLDETLEGSAARGCKWGARGCKWCKGV